MTYPSSVSSDDLKRFSQVATINDEAGFLLVLDQLVAERRTNKPAHNLPLDVMARAKAFTALAPYRPAKAEMQRGRSLQLAELKRKTNVSVTRFAALAGKSRQRLHKEISARKLLALSTGPYVARVPDWQHMPAARALTRTVLHRATEVDPWTIYQALSAPDERFGGKAPVAAVTLRTVEDVADYVCGRLGIHG